MRRSWLGGVLVVMLLGAVGCGSGDGGDGSDDGGVPSDDPAESSDESGSSPTAGGFAALGSLIPEAAVGDEPTVLFEHLAALGDLGFELPATADPDYVLGLNDTKAGTGAGTTCDGLDCRECDADAYGASFEEAMGFAPGAPERVIVVGRSSDELALLEGGVDPDELAAAFDGDETYTVERDGDTVRISSSCEVGEALCTEEGPRDKLGRGLHVWSDGEVTALSFVPDLVDGVAAAAESGDGTLEADHPLLTVLAAADELDLVVGTGGVPPSRNAWVQSCGESAGVTEGIPEGTMVLVGVGPTGSDGMEMVLAVDVADESDADDVATLFDELFAGEQCLNRQPFDELFDMEAAEVDGSRVSVSGEVIGTAPRSSDGTDAPRGSIWRDLWLKRELPYLT